jgi:hypothetical protein
MPRRVTGYVLGLYLLFAVIGRFVEAMRRALRLRARLLVQAPNPEHVSMGVSLPTQVARLSLRTRSMRATGAGEADPA